MIDDMQWPTWCDKIGGFRVWIAPANMGLAAHFRDWYYGDWLMFIIGCVVIQMGRGRYVEAEQ